MKRQYLRLFSFLIGITFIISGILFTLVNNYKVEKREKIKEEIILGDEIGNVYETFYNKTKELSDYRDEIYNDIKEFTIYYTQIPDGYAKEVPKFQKYEEMISEIEDASSFLKDKCTKRYSVLEANDKCTAYYINLEKTINLFLVDLDTFNAKIKEFNEWTETENASVIATKKYDKLEEIKGTKYTEYVDLNNDGTYLGSKSE